MKRIIVRLIPFMAGLVIVAGLFFATLQPAPVYASDVALDATPSGQTLENWYTRLKLVSDNQQARLDYSRQVAQAAQKWIDAINNSGTDATELQHALDAFNQGISDAQQEHDMGKAILDAHAGFDNNGQVTRPREAWDTIRETAKHFRKAHVTITSATLNFREAVHTWRQTH